ncbi:Neuropathy target esterase [Holothuria leucospilota]|uniref:Neuropathy target esterase n=1 Tax=Holothuria leucospilota TaxID=206669 RepID=A0A9Q1C517_HOLLE|nr:Neuropathy target esterase [Holothuria leucospilota]
MMLTRLQRITFQTLHNFFGLTKELLAVEPSRGSSRRRSKRRSVRSISKDPNSEDQPRNLPTQTSGNEELEQKPEEVTRTRLRSANTSSPQLSSIVEEGVNSNIEDEVTAKAAIQVVDDRDVLTNAAQQMAKILGLEDENIIKSELRLLKFQPDVPVVSAGSKDTNLVFVASGTLQITQKIPETDIPKTVHVAQTGELLGEMAVMTGEPQQYAIKSGKSETVLALMSKNAVDKIIEDHPNVAVRISHFVVKKMSTFTRQTDYAIEWLILESGQKLFSHDEDAQDIYIVLNGRLRSVVSGPDGKKHIVEEFGRGDLIGLAEVVAGEKRHSTVHAVRDSELTKIPMGTLSFIKSKYPAPVTSKVIQKIGDRLSVYLSEKPAEQSNISQYMQRASNLSTVAVLPITSDVPLSQFSKELTAALSKIGPSVCLTYKDVIETFGLKAFDSIQKFHLTSWMNTYEDHHKIVVYETDRVGKEWTRRCLRQADCILLVGMADHDPTKIGDMERELNSLGLGIKRALVLLHRSKNGKYENPTRTAQWLNARDWCSSYHHIRCPEEMFTEFLTASSKNIETSPDNDFGRLARYLTGTSVGLVLGGGGARGLSHVGIIKAMKEKNIPIDLVGGTSIGSFVGASYCTDPSLQSLEILTRKLCAKMSSIWEIIFDLTYPYCALFTGRRFNMALRSILGHKQIEDLWLPYFCISTDVTDSKMRVHMDGSLWRYVRSSMSLAGYFPPLCDPKDKHLLLDGGYANNLPADIMKAMGAQTIFAVDVGGVSDTNFHDFGDDLSGFWMLWQKWNPVARKVKIPDLPEIHSRLAYIASNRMLGEVVTSESYHYIRPAIDDYGLTSFDKYEEIRDVGYSKGMQLFSKLQHEDFYTEEKSKHDKETMMRRKIRSILRTVVNLETLYMQDSDNGDN